MIIELICAIFFGIIVGTISGLTPGIHINMISLIVLSLSPLLVSEYHIGLLSLCVFIIVLGIVHTFLDAIPSIFLGAPDESTALGILPGHRYLLRGNGLMAVKLFTLGSFFGLIAAILMFPLLYIVTKYSYDVIEPFFAIILIAVSGFMLWRDTKKFWAISVFAISGVFGMLVFNLEVNDPLLPMLSGLFGISTLLTSLNDKNSIPEQNKQTGIKLDKKKFSLSMLAGNFSAFLVSTFPGLSSSIAAVLSIQFVKDLGDKGFMILLGCIGTSSFILSLVALYTVDKARNGAVIVISKLIEMDTRILIIFIAASLVAGGVAVFLSLYIGKIFARLITKVNYKMLVLCVITLIIVIVGIISGWLGLLILIVSTAIGLIPAIIKVQRTHAMACLIVPVITYLL